VTNEPAPAAALLHEHTADRRNTQALVAFGNRLVNSLTFRTAYAAFPKEIIRPPHAWATTTSSDHDTGSAGLPLET